jgi:hypothetical protein
MVKKISLKRLSQGSSSLRTRRPTGGGVKKKRYTKRAKKPRGGGRRGGKRTKKRGKKKKKSRGRKGRRSGGSCKAVTAAKKRKLRNILPLLKTLQDVRPHNNRSILLSHLDDEACEALYETLYNVMGNPKLGDKKKASLRKILWDQQDNIDFLTKSGKKFTPKLKRKKLAAMGGFPLAAILSAGIPLLLDLLTSKK